MLAIYDHNYTFRNKLIISEAKYIYLYNVDIVKRHKTISE